MALCALALVGAGTTPPHGPVSQVLGRIGHGQPYDAWLAMAPNGRAAVLWARSPQESGTPLELALTPPGGRFGPPQMIGKAPFGPLSVGLAISGSGAVTVAVGPDTGGLLVIRRSATGHLYPPQHLVGRQQWLARLSLAPGAGGAMLLAWDSQPRSAQGDGPDSLHAAWLRSGRSTFDRPVSLGPAGSLLHLGQALFVGAGTAVVSWGTDLPPRQECLSFAPVGRPFGHPLTVAAGAAGLLADRVAPDGAGGAFVVVSTMSATTFRSSLSVMAARSDGIVSPAQIVARGNLQGFELNPAGAGRALLTWAAGGKLRAVALAPGSATPLPGSIGVPGDYALALDPAGAGILSLAPVFWPKSAALPVWRVSYGLVSTTRPWNVTARPLGTSTAPPQVAIDSQGRGLVLWVGPQGAGGPVEVLRVRAR